MIMISSAGFFGKKTMGNLPRNGEIICKKIIKLLKLRNERFERSLVGEGEIVAKRVKMNGVF